MVVAAGCGRLTLPPPTAAPATAPATPTEAAPAASSPAATTALTPVPSAPTVPSGPPVAAIETAPLGSLHGEWIYVLEGTAAGGREYAEVWAVRPDGTQALRIARYLPFTSIGINPIGADRPDLRRQLSPDGRFLLVTAELGPGVGGGAQVGVAALELATGRTMRISSDPNSIDFEAAWSPDGRWIAFSRARLPSPTEREVWLMRPDGSDRRRLAGGGIVYGFTPDGKYLCMSSGYDYACVDIASGQVQRFTGTIPTSPFVVSPGSWRQGTPAFVGAFIDNGQRRIDVADGVGLGQRTIVRGSGEQARWRPGADEILYRSGDKLFVMPLGGTPRKAALPILVRRAEWSPGGAAIHAVGSDPGTPPGPPTANTTSLRRVTADGASSTEIFRPSPGPGSGLFELVAVSYQ